MKRMKKSKRFLSVIMGIAMSVSAISAISVGAVEIEEEKIYTLEELMEMSKDEFMSLDGAEDDIRNVKGYVEVNEFTDPLDEPYKTMGSFGFRGSVGEYIPGSHYVPNVTEKNIKELLGSYYNDDGMECDGYGTYFNDEFMFETPITFNAETEPTYMADWFNFHATKYNDLEINEENIIMAAKWLHCLRQIVSDNLCFVGNTRIDLAYSSSETILSGDVNVDKTIDIFDAVYIANYTVGNFEFTEGQLKVGDVNNDGECNIFDAAEIAKKTVEK